jgi:hypothetical protein
MRLTRALAAAEWDSTLEFIIIAATVEDSYSFARKDVGFDSHGMTAVAALRSAGFRTRARSSAAADRPTIARNTGR